jgi:hypothetical protein
MLPKIIFFDNEYLSFTLDRQLTDVKALMFNII